MSSTAGRYAARVDHRTIFLTPFGRSPRPDRAAWSATKLLLVDHANAGLVIRTGCRMGYVHLTIRPLDGEPDPMASCMDIWEIGEEHTVDIAEPLTLMSPMANDPVVEGAFAPTRPGLHRVRVLARGRAENLDLINDRPGSERYDVSLWPVETVEPVVRLGDDGVH